MPLHLTDASLDWSLKHAINYGDTDIFPEAFEFAAIQHDWEDIKKYLKEQDILEWNVRPYRRCMVPKHRFGFRISTQLDPLDFLIFTSLIYEVGEEIESNRILSTENIVYSYRFGPSEEGKLFSDEFKYSEFQNRSKVICDEYQPEYVVIADIADFFPRLYTHRIDNSLDSALSRGSMHCEALKKLINMWAGTYSYGLPVGSAASRLVAELTIGDIDQLLLSENTKYLRYSDDFRIFCKTEEEAYGKLALLATNLFNNHGLTLQQHKTKIIETSIFRHEYLREDEEREIDTLSERFYELLEQIGIKDPYEDIDYSTLPAGAQEAIDSLNLREILIEQIQEPLPDLSLMKFTLKRLAQLNDGEAINVIFDNVSAFAPVVREVINYLVKLNIREDSKKVVGDKITEYLVGGKSVVSHLEYNRMYLLSLYYYGEYRCDGSELVKIYNTTTDDFTKRKAILSLGKTKMDYWFRNKKMELNSMNAWIRRSFIYAASCLPGDEYKHWVRGMNNQFDCLEKAISKWAILNSIHEHCWLAKKAHKGEHEVNLVEDVPF